MGKVSGVGRNKTIERKKKKKAAFSKEPKGPDFPGELVEILVLRHLWLSPDLGGQFLCSWGISSIPTQVSCLQEPVALVEGRKNLMMSRVPSTAISFSWVRRREWGARASEGASNLAHRVDWFYMGWARAEPGAPARGMGVCIRPCSKRKPSFPGAHGTLCRPGMAKNHCPRR